MPKFFVRWRIDNSMLAIPATPEEIRKLFSSMLEMVKEDLRYNSFTEWGQFANGTDGYVLSELNDVADLAAVMNKYRPLITWDIRPVLGLDESMVVINEAGATVRLD